MNKSRILALAASTLLAASLAATAAAAIPAGASTPLAVTLSASSDGASATWAGPASIALKVGSTSSTTYAQVKLTSPPAAEPSSPPSFTTDNYAAGSPRWVIVLSDGYYLFGYPAQLGGGAKADFTGPQWQVNGPSATKCAQYVTYATALACADPAGSSSVTSAYIVADGDQAAGTTDTLTGIQYDGQGVQQPAPPVAQPTGPVSSYTDYSRSCLDNANFTWKAGNPLQLWACGAAGSADQQFRFATVSGHQVLEAVAPAGKPQGPWCVTVHGERGRLTIEPCTGSAAQQVTRSGAYYVFAGGLVMDDAAWNAANGARVIGFPRNGGRNQRWSQP